MDTKSQKSYVECRSRATLNIPPPEEEDQNKKEMRNMVEKLCRCDRIISDTEVNNFRDISKLDKYYAEDATFEADECQDDFEAEYLKLSHILDLPGDTHSLTKIETNLSPCLKYGFRSGRTHMKMHKFSPLSRGYQGPAIAVAAITTALLIKPHCWNEPIIDQVIEDGDTYYCKSYKKIETSDRRTLTLLDLQRELIIRKSHRVVIKIDEPIYAGTFRSETPKDLHIATALNLFFKRYNAGVLTSSVLNIAIWKSSKHYNIFDGQERSDNCEITTSIETGSAKLFLAPNLPGLLLIILEKSNVKNEPFVLYGITILDIKKVSELPIDTGKSLGEPKRRPSGYQIQETYRAIVRGTFHLHHPIFPQEYHGRGHLVVAVAALIYSKLLSASKWMKVMIDLIFNQSHIYLTDLSRVAGHKLDETFAMTISDLICDVVLGVYTAKIQVAENVIPGQGKRGKMLFSVGIRNFFAHNSLGIIEVKEKYYAIWKEKNKFYFLDPFACDSEGFRVDQNESGRYRNASACVTMNSSVDQILETLINNTESREKDPFIIHGINVLYVKTGSARDGSDEKVVFREKNVNRRPEAPPSPPSSIADECATIIDTLPRPRFDPRETIDRVVQYPELMYHIEAYINTFDESKYLEVDMKMSSDDIVTSDYHIVNPHKLILPGTRSCLDERFSENSRGKQGLIIALAAIVRSKQLIMTDWTRIDVTKIIVQGHVIYERLLSWLCCGSPEDQFIERPEKEEDETKTAEAETQYEYEEENKESMSIEHLELDMLPNTIKFGDKFVNLAWKTKVTEGEANPLVNLGEALEQYFEEYNEMILENKKLMYAIWRKCKKFFILNPYGSDFEGWRISVNNDPATLFVVDSINELVNLLYGMLDFNDYYFIFHYIKISFKYSEDDNDDPAFDTSEIKTFEKYKTQFLPVTDEDLENMKDTKSYQTLTINEGDKEGTEYGTDVHTIYAGSGITALTKTSKVTLKLENMVFNYVEEDEEPELLDTPERLNLALVTGIVKIEHMNESAKNEENFMIFYEKLKYRHPPPFIMPPAKNLCDLKDCKIASKSIQSLLSRFSINSKLAIKEKTESAAELEEDATINYINITEKAKLITLPPKKYLFSNSLPSGLTPIRAINEQFIRDKRIEKEKEEECRKEKMKKDIVLIPEKIPDLSMKQILPSIIPLGPCIKTPKPIRRLNECPERKKRKCKLNCREREDVILKKLVCSTENLILELLVPDFREILVIKPPEEPIVCEIPEPESNTKKLLCKPEEEPCGFEKTDDENIGIISGEMSLDDRETIDETHYKSCFFASILCILAKINVSVNKFRTGVVDRFILAANKISKGTGKLRYMLMRYFRNVNILETKYNVIIKQERYADPQSHKPDSVEYILESFLNTFQTGIIVLKNASYAFWKANDVFYLFDPYPCDENGRVAAEGKACLMEICDYKSFINRLVENVGESANLPYRIYTVSIAHIKEKKKVKPKKPKPCKHPFKDEPNVISETESVESEDAKSEGSLIELVEWINEEKAEMPPLDTSTPGFVPIRNFDASALEATVLENDITRPILAPFKDDIIDESMRTKPYDRDFYDNSVLAEPFDMCIMAWSQLYEPQVWSMRTIKGLFEASKDYTLDCVLANEDTTVPELIDGLLPEFNIANYSFRVVFAPLHTGTLYTMEGWNLAMSLDKIFESPVFTGAVLVCESSHIGVMKKGGRFYAWWLVRWTKNIRIIVSDHMEDYLKLIIKEINQPCDTKFRMRIITISYAKMFGPNCSDLDGLHESLMPSSSISEIHRKQVEGYNLDTIFQPVDKSSAPVFILGSVALRERDAVTEPRVKRCYFAGLFAVMLKRDIIQNPLPGMIDKILELAEISYKLFEEPKFHTEHILKDVSLMNRIFDFRDCASLVVNLPEAKLITETTNFFVIVKKHMKQFFKKSTSGIIQFSNCCYGFWYSSATKCYYYLDPYQCDSNGRRVNSRGKSCLCVFSSICDFVRQMCFNQFEDTTGFFIHRIHVQSVNSLATKKFQEDPMWIYLDYHWSYRHVAKPKSQKIKRTKEQIAAEESKKPKCKNYLIEVPNMIYSLWGTLGAFDLKFSTNAGKSQAAIGIVAFAMRNLHHPSEWTTAVLDSIVVSGDYFYNESKKAYTQCLNRYSLLECLKLSPYIWCIEFRSDICGVLYSTAADQANFTDCIEYGLKKSPNLLLQCKCKILAILQTTDAFYVVDSAWTGPPLFSGRRGAIYVIRCKNLNTLIYVVTKMLNTNQRLEFTLTPVRMSFKEEVCQSSDETPKASRKLFLEKPARASPGPTVEHPTLVNGNVTVTDEDSYLCYSRNLKLGLTHGAEYEKIADKLIGQSRKGSHTTSKGKRVCKKARGSKIHKEQGSLVILETEVPCPRVVDLVKETTEDCLTGYIQKTLGLAPETKKEAKSDDKDKKSPCKEKAMEIRKSFVLDETRDMFDDYSIAMQKDVYKTYRHMTKATTVIDYSDIDDRTTIGFDNIDTDVETVKSEKTNEADEAASEKADEVKSEKTGDATEGDNADEEGGDVET